jgi:agmatinase
MFIPPSVPFLSSRPSIEGQVILFGAPLDATESFRNGTEQAPARIRAVSDVLETYSPTLDRDLESLHFVDAGDLDLHGHSVDGALARIERATDQVVRWGLPIMLGGEHTATLPAFNAVARVYPDVLLLHFDAHMDMRERYEGRDIGHATWLYHVAARWGFERIIQAGIRSGTRDEFALARRLMWSSPSLDLPQHVQGALERRPCYVSIDIDVLDPACAPGTGCPEPGGPTFAELLAALHALRGSRVVGIDVMEVLPAVDHADITSIAAAKLVRETALLFGQYPDARAAEHR